MQNHVAAHRTGASRAVATSLGLVLLAAASAAAQDTGLTSPSTADPLAGYVAEALRSNLELRQQRLAEARAGAAVTQARGMFLPTLSLQARYSEASGVLNIGDLVNPAYAALNRLTSSTSFPTNINATLPYRQETMLHLVQPLFQPALLPNHRLQSTLATLESSRTSAAARRIGAQVRTAYLDLAKATRVVELYRALLPVLDENVRVNERLVANGKATPEVVLRARAERGDVAQKLMEAERQQAAAREYFDFLLDRPLAAPVELVPDSALERPLALSLAEALDSARAGREELRQASLGVKAARAQRSLARAAFVPAIALAVDYGVQGQSYRFDTRHDVAVASVVLQWNLFNGGQDAARLAAAGLDADRAEARQAEAARQVALEVAQAWRGAEVAWRAIGTARERQAAARRAFELVQRRYQEGVASQLEFLDARAAFTSAALNEVMSRYEYASRRVELERAAALGPAVH